MAEFRLKPARAGYGLIGSTGPRYVDRNDASDPQVGTKPQVNANRSGQRLQFNGRMAGSGGTAVSSGGGAGTLAGGTSGVGRLSMGSKAYR